MSDALRPIYNHLGQIITEALEQKEWQEASIDAEIDGDSGSFRGTYILTNKTTGEFDIPSDMFEFFNVLQMYFENEYKQKWNKATFTMTPEGKFTFNVKQQA